MEHFDLNRVSLTRAILDSAKIYRVSLHSKPDFTNIRLACEFDGESLNEQISGSTCQFDINMSFVKKDKGFSVTGIKIELVNSAELRNKHAIINSNMAHIANGVHQVLKTNVASLEALVSKFLKHKFLHVDFKVEDSLVKHPLEKGFDSLQPVCIHFDHFDCYLIGNILYTDEMTIPNSCEANSYCLYEKPISRHILYQAKNIQVKSLLLSFKSDFGIKYDAYSIFKNIEKDMHEMLHYEAGRIQNVFKNLKELWFERDVIYSNFIKPKFDSDQLIIHHDKTTDLALKALLLTVMEDTAGYLVNPDNPLEIFWEVSHNLNLYKLSAAIEVVDGRISEISNVNLYCNSTPIHVIDIDTVAPSLRSYLKDMVGAYLRLEGRR